ncbi:MAG: hypothetical protein ACE5HJ_06050 [Thermoplasmata archaeon]
MDSVVAFDGKEFKREGFQAEFIAILGAAVRIKDYTSFNESFDTAYRKLSSKYSFLPGRKFHKSYDLSTYLGRKEADDFNDSLLHSIESEIDEVAIYHTQIPPSKLPEIYVGGEDKPRAVGALHFLKQLNNAYPHLCAWKYSTEARKGDRFLLDYFQSDVTPAWDVVKERHPLIYIHGDSCNRAIAVADIMANIADARLHYSGLKLTTENLERVFENQGIPVKADFIGQPDMKHIVPQYGQQINLYRWVKDPVFFYISEKRPEALDYDEATYLVARSPAFGHLLDLACEADGCVKKYQERQDGNLFPKARIAGYVGPRGKEVAESLEQNYSVEPLNLSDIIKEDKD